MMSVSKGTRPLFKEARKDDIQIAYLRKLLRKENSEIPEALRQYFYSASDAGVSASSAANTHHVLALTPNTKKTLSNVKALLSAYNAYFEHFLAMYKQYEDGGNDTWPTEGMEELGCRFAGVKEKEAALPIKLIQGTGLGVLQATAKYVNRFASMANDNNFDGDTLDRLAVQGLGGAQKAAGDSIVDLYFRGDSMTEGSRRSSTSWSGDLNPKLGSKWWLLIYNGEAHRPSARRRPGCRAPHAPCMSSRNSLSLIKVLTAKLDLSLRHEAARADENDQALPSP